MVKDNKKNYAKKVQEQRMIYGKKTRSDETFKKQTKLNRIELAQYKKDSGIRYFYDDNQILKLNIKTENVKIYNQVFRDFGVNRMPVKKVIKAEPIKDMKILKDLNELYANNNKVNLVLRLTYKFQISEDIVERIKIITWDGNAKNYYLERGNFFNYVGNENINNLVQFIQNYSNQYLEAFPQIGHIDDVIRNVIKTAVIISDLQRGQTMYIDPATMRMREEKPLDISYIYNDIIELKETTENCVINYLKSTYSKISEKNLNIGNEDGVNANELCNFAKKYNIKSLVYDISGNVITSNYPEKQNKSYKSLIGISYNNHFYPVKNQFLNKVRIPEKVKIIKNVDEECMKLLKNNKLPTNMLLGTETIKNDGMKDDVKIKVLTFCDDKIKYVNNDDYDICLSILDVFGLKDKITPYTNLKNIYSIIEQAYITENIDSYFDVDNCKGGFNYYNHNIKVTEDMDIKSLDHSKFYSKMLCDLPFLVSVDTRQVDPIIHDTNPEYVIEHHLYIAKPKNQCLLMDNTDIYTGEHLIKCHERGIKFDILEEIKTIRHENFFKRMINDIYDKLDDKKYLNYEIDGKKQDLRKYITNVFIGKFESTMTMNDSLVVEKVCNFQERMKEAGNYVKYNGFFMKVKDNKIFKNLYNRKPISIQVKDSARVTLFDKIQELEIKENELINIETDSISFINKGQKLKLGKNWYSWKIINKDIEYFYNRSKCSFGISGYDATFKKLKHDNDSVMYDCYAGAGKSYHIINKLIPSLKDYIILTPSHNSAKQYYKLKLNCKVIQYYNFNNDVPKEQNIIIDEIGLCDRKANNLICKLNYMKKNIYSFGDFKQLLPINEIGHFNSENYLNCIYGTINRVHTNYRNNFTKEYYDSLLNAEKNIDYLIDEILKHSCNDPTNADVVICITNESKKMYNTMLSKHYKKDLYSIGARIVCNTNNLRDKNIYNSFDFVIKSINDDDEDNIIYTLDDSTEITKKELTDNFELGYSITLYKAQGQEYKSFYFPPEDANFINPRVAYTLISRLKQDLTNETLERNMKMSI